MSDDKPVKAFLLTRDWRDTDSGIALTFWAQSEIGPLRILIPGQRAVCFIDRDTAFTPLAGERRQVELMNPGNRPVDGLYFNRQRALQQLLSPAAVPRKHLFETDIRPADRFLMERFITGGITVHGKLKPRSGFHEITHCQLKPEVYKPGLRVVSVDIETDYETEALFSIAVQGSGDDRVFLLSNAPVDSDLVETVSNEKQLLQRFLNWITAADPDVIIGWNVIGFDLSVLERRCKLHKVPFNLGRDRGASHVLPASSINAMAIARVPGRVVMDGIESLRAAFYSFENFSLDAVANELLGKGKLISGDQHRGEEIRQLFHTDPLALARYNLEDCRLVSEIFTHTGLIDFALERAAATGLTLGRVGGSVAAFDFLYLPRLHRKGYVAKDPPLDQAGGLSSPGGYVLDSRPGLYDDVLVLDFKSLYPSIIRTFKIDPLASWEPGDDRVQGFQGASFNRRHPILPEILEHLWARRDEAKREQNAALSQAVKIIMNSFYGVLGTSACRFFDPRLTSSITRRGHEIIQRSRQLIEEEGYEVIYGDTDSLFVWLTHAPSEFEARNTGDRLATLLNQWWNETLRREHQVQSHLEIEFETHYVKFLMPTVRGSGAGSKKRYAGMVHNSRGDKELIFKGLETVRTDWTVLAREFQQELFRRVFQHEDVEHFIADTHSRLYAGHLDDKLIYRKQLRQPLSDYVRNIPPHAQAAKKMQQPGRWIEYLICASGPEPIEKQPLTPDYNHYAERQLKPVADTILTFLDTSYDEIVGGQLSLFR